jgi:hypothetical protein
VITCEAGNRRAWKLHNCRVARGTFSFLSTKCEYMKWKTLHIRICSYSCSVDWCSRPVLHWVCLFVCLCMAKYTFL